MVTISDIAYTIFGLENHSDIWTQGWKFHIDDKHTSNIEEEKVCDYKRLTVTEMVDKELSVGDQRCYLKVEPKFTHAQKKVSFCDAVKTEGIKFYKQTH